MTETKEAINDVQVKSDGSEIEVYLGITTESDVDETIECIKKYNNVIVTLKVEPGDDVRHIEPLARLPQLSGLGLSGYHKTGTLAPFLKQAALTKFLRYLYIESYFNAEELKELYGISSLIELTCGFSNYPGIHQLSALENLEMLSVTDEVNSQIVAQVTSLVKKSEGIHVLSSDIAMIAFF